MFFNHLCEWDGFAKENKLFVEVVIMSRFMLFRVTSKRLHLGPIPTPRMRASASHHQRVPFPSSRNITENISILQYQESTNSRIYKFENLTMTVAQVRSALESAGLVEALWLYCGIVPRNYMPPNTRHSIVASVMPFPTNRNQTVNRDALTSVTLCLNYYFV